MAIINGNHELNAKESIKINISYVRNVFDKIVQIKTVYNIELLCSGMVLSLSNCTLTLNTILYSYIEPTGKYLSIINDQKGLYEYFIHNMPVTIQSIKIVDNNSIIDCVYEGKEFIVDSY